MIATNDRPEISETADLVKAILDLDTSWDRQREGLQIEQMKGREIKQECETGHVLPRIQLTPG